MATHFVFKNLFKSGFSKLNTLSVCCLKRNGDCLAKTQRTQRAHPIARAGTRHGTCKRKLRVKAFQTAFGKMQGCADFMRLWRNFMGATDKPCGVRPVANPKLLLNGT